VAGPALTGRLRRIEARDLDGYFGARRNDPEYVRAYLAFVPAITYYLVDARLWPERWVRK
jgi:hypothetical protein